MRIKVVIRREEIDGSWTAMPTQRFLFTFGLSRAHLKCIKKLTSEWRIKYKPICCMISNKFSKVQEINAPTRNIIFVSVAVSTCQLEFSPFRTSFRHYSLWGIGAPFHWMELHPGGDAAFWWNGRTVGKSLKQIKYGKQVKLMWESPSHNWTKVNSLQEAYRSVCEFSPHVFASPLESQIPLSTFCILKRWHMLWIFKLLWIISII